MRRIGSLADPSDARRFCDYLVTLSIDAIADEGKKEDASEWDIWIRDEEHIDQAKEEFAKFLQSPSDSRYAVKAKADKIRDGRIADQKRRLKNQQAYAHRTPSRAGGVMSGVGVRQQNIPVTIAIIAISVVLGFATDMGRPKPSPDPGPSMQEQVWLICSFVDFRDYKESDGDAFASVKKGEAWRAITPMFLHGGIMHLAFNMMALFFLGSALERIHGSVFFASLAIGTHIVGMMLQVWLPDASALPEVLHRLAGSPFAVGASGAVYGLFGYVWVRPAIDSSYPIRIPEMNVIMMLGWLLAGIFLVNGIANGAHIGGLAGGIVAAFITVQFAKSRE